MFYCTVERCALPLTRKVYFRSEHRRFEHGMTSTIHGHFFTRDSPYKSEALNRLLYLSQKQKTNKIQGLFIKSFDCIPSFNPN